MRRTVALTAEAAEVELGRGDLKAVPFEGHTILAFRHGGRVYVPIRPICERLRISFATQQRKIKNRRPYAQAVVMMTTVGVGSGRQMLCLPVEMVHGWLLNIDPDKVRVDLQDTLVAYQLKCMAVLHAFFGGHLPPREAPVGEDLDRHRELWRALASDWPMHYTKVLADIDHHGRPQLDRRTPGIAQGDLWAAVRVFVAWGVVQVARDDLGNVVYEVVPVDERPALFSHVEAA